MQRVFYLYMQSVCVFFFSCTYISVNECARQMEFDLSAKPEVYFKMDNKVTSNLLKGWGWPGIVLGLTRTWW